MSGLEVSAVDRMSLATKSIHLRVYIIILLLEPTINSIQCLFSTQTLLIA